MLDITNVINNKSVDNLFDAIYTIYVGRYIQEVLKEEPDYSNLDCTELKGKVSISSYYNFYIHAKQQGWINSTFELFDEIELDNDKSKRDTSLHFVESLVPIGVVDNFDINIVNEYYDKIYMNNQYQVIYTSYVAYLVVKRFESLRQGNTDWKRIRIQVNEQVFTIRYGYMFVFHIMQYPEVLETVHDMLDKIKPDDRHTFIFDNWIYDNTDKGNLSEDGYTYKEKIEQLEKSKYYQPGLPIFMYEKSNNITAGNSTGLKQVSLAVINGFTEQLVDLTVLSTRSTKEDINALMEDNMHLSDIYIIEDGFYSLHQRREVIDMTSLGIDYVMMGTARLWAKTVRERKDNEYLGGLFEEKFFIKGVGEYNTTEVNLTRPELPVAGTNKHVYYKFRLNYAEAVYWIMKDWGISFDSELFKEVYKDYLYCDKPLYDLTTEEFINEMKNSRDMYNRTIANNMELQYKLVKQIEERKNKLELIKSLEEIKKDKSNTEDYVKEIDNQVSIMLKEVEELGITILDLDNKVNKIRTEQLETK